MSSHCGKRYPGRACCIQSNKALAGVSFRSPGSRIESAWRRVSLGYLTEPLPHRLRPYRRGFTGALSRVSRRLEACVEHSMADAANAGEAERCLDIARAALQAGDSAKAVRFAEKALKLHPHDEARKVLRAARTRAGQANGAPPAGPSSSTFQRSASSGAHSSARPPSGTFSRNASSSDAGPSESQAEDTSTPEERELVRAILSKKDNLYAVLNIERNATDDEIKKAYRKLALKLHPDKNKARGADEAFKVVSKAFSCLSDSDKRSRYDRYGDETPGLARTRSGTPQGFDAEEIFNAFFGFAPGGFNRGPMMRAHGPFGGGPFGAFPHQQQGGGGQQQGNPLLGLITVLPLIAILLTSFLFNSADPVWALDRNGGYVYELSTGKLNVPFFVKSVTEYDRQYPAASLNRIRLEREVEGAFHERLQRRCYLEQMEKQRMSRWGGTTRAQALKMPACQEYNEIFGNRQYYTSSAF
ncbi:hypothetical protein WJX73_007854 [Symbiochloris irregularis]|uniref:J domain-containing protein n=1 Tax=Symbiochloris irregularis TaxID=706552 RepID=A0AAW1NZK8_9CHLO